jgi:type IV secretory pathway VirB2 component (pilin)
MNGDMPATTNVFAAADQWLQGTLLGTVATTVAVIAVASVGFLLMSGRVDMRRAAQVILGCFILFGASSIAAGIMRVVGAGDAQAEVAPVSPPAPVYAAPAEAAPYDPYAGAAVPPRP